MTPVPWTPPREVTFATVEKSYGSLRVEAKTAGRLYLDGGAIGNMTAATAAELDNLETGNHTLEMRYDDGKTESRTVTVLKDRTVQAVFGYVPQPKAPEGFVLVEEGTFRMGSALSAQEVVAKFGGKEEWYKNEKPVHSVTIGRSFFMSRYEVTVEQFRRFVSDTGYRTTAEREGGALVWTGSKWETKADANWKNPYFDQADSSPVVCVSWYDAVEYCNRLSRKEGLSPCYSGSGENIRCDFSADGYRLPTEAEWEFAARGGSKSRGYVFSGSDDVDDVGWYSDNSKSRTHAVGQKQPSELGLYDMSGNVYEWCWDWYGNYSGSSQTDPHGPSSGSLRVFRGGGWHDAARNLRAALRGRFTPSFRYSRLGCRPLRTAE